jgi:hypothetical protein
MGHIFDLPDYSASFAKFVTRATQELMRRKDPVFASIKVVESPQVATVRNTMPSGQIVENNPMAVPMPFVVVFQDAIAGNLASLVASIETGAEVSLKIVMPQIFAYSGRLCEAAGTATDAGGQKLSRKLIRESFEKMQINFDAAGQPIMPTMMMHPDMLKQLEDLPPATDEEIRAWDEMIERKRGEFNDRRRHRKLS